MLRYPPGKPAACVGFSFLELLVVIMVLGMITGMIVPVYGASMASIRARNTQRGLASTLIHTQERAVAESRELRLYIDEEEKSYWVAYRAGENEGEKVFLPVDDAYGRLRYFPENIKVKKLKAHEDRQLKAHYVACYPNGACDRALLEFEDERDPDRSFSIETLGALGKIEIEQ